MFVQFIGNLDSACSQPVSTLPPFLVYQLDIHKHTNIISTAVLPWIVFEHPLPYYKPILYASAHWTNSLNQEKQENKPRIIIN